MQRQNLGSTYLNSRRSDRLEAGERIRCRICYGSSRVSGLRRERLSCIGCDVRAKREERSGSRAAGRRVFFSQAVSPAEAVEEAEFVLEHLKHYNITGPVVFDTEEIKWDSARTDGKYAAGFYELLQSVL